MEPIPMGANDQDLGSCIVTRPPFQQTQPRRSLIQRPPGPTNPGFDRRRCFRRRATRRQIPPSTAESPVSDHQAVSTRKVLPRPLSRVTRYSPATPNFHLESRPTFRSFKRSSMMPLQELGIAHYRDGCPIDGNTTICRDQSRSLQNLPIPAMIFSVRSRQCATSVGDM